MPTDDKCNAEGPNRRRFLKAAGSTALITSLAGCDLQDEEESTPDTDEGDGTPTNDGSTEGDGTPTDGGSGETDSWAAQAAAVNTEFATEEPPLVRATFSDEHYTEIEGAIPGLDAPEDATPTGHAVTYGHRAESIGGDPPEAPTVNVLSAGAMSLPAPEEEGSNLFAEASLSEIVGFGDGNLFLATAGLGRSVEWLGEPVSIDQRETEFLDGTGTVETFVGVVSAESGPGMPTGAAETTAGVLDAGSGGGAPTHNPGSVVNSTGVVPRGQLVTVHAARTFVGGDVVMMGMVGGWRRPPTMGPPREEIGPETRGLLADLYDDVIRAALFTSVLGETGTLAAALLPDEDERPPPPDTRTVEESASDPWGLDEDDQIELGYPDEESNDDTLLEIFVEGRDVPGLLSGEAYDEEIHSPGTKYYVKPDTAGLSYPLDDEGTFPFGVITSPLVQVEGEERNPLATEPLAEVMTGFDGVWDLLRWTGEFSDMDWDGGPTEFESVSGLGIDGNAATAKGFEGAIARVPTGESRTVDDASVYAARVTTSDEVIVAVAINLDSEAGYFNRDESAKRLFEDAVGRVVRNPATPSDWADASIDDLDLVQIVSNTRLETASGDQVQQSDPALVQGRNVAPLFDCSTFNGTALSSYDPAYGVFSFDVANRSGSDPYTVLEQSDLQSLDQGSVDPATLFDGKSGENDLAVFELDGDHSSVTLESHAPSGYEYDTRKISEGSDYDIADAQFLRVGFITVEDPDGGSNYGDGNGRTTRYDDTVDAAFEYIRRTYPAGIAAYRHDSAIEGNNKENGDYKDARAALERVADPSNSDWTYSGTTMAHKSSESDAESAIKQNGFDVWVLIVPDGYYDYHKNNSSPAGLAPVNKRLAVTAVEGPGVPNGIRSAAQTVAQEIGHRMGSNQYRDPSNAAGMNNPLAQRDDSGTQVFTDRDLDHARHLGSTNDDDSDTPPDAPGVVSMPYSVVDGEFSAPSVIRYGPDFSLVGPGVTYQNAYGPDNSANPYGRIESYMSYSPRVTWADSVITKNLLDNDFTRDAKNFKTVTLFTCGSTSQASAGADTGDETADAEGVSVDDMRVLDGWHYEIDEARFENEESPIRIELLGPGGEVVSETTATSGIGIRGDGVEEEELAEAVLFDIDFAPRGVDVVIDREGAETRVNPITRPLRDAYDRVPERGFVGDVEVARGELEELSADVDGLMADGAFGEARDRLTTYVETGLPEVIDPEFEPLANQPDEARLETLFEEMIGRLDGLATDDEPTGGDVPGWTDWVPHPSSFGSPDQFRLILQYDVASLINTDNGAQTAESTDAMKNPFVAGFAGSLAQFNLGGVGLAEPIFGGPVFEDDVDPSTVPAETGVIVGDVGLYLGSFDESALQSAVEEGTFSATDSPGVYAHDEEEVVVSWGEGYVVVGSTVDQIETVEGTAAGDIDRWHEVDDDVEWALGTAGHGGFTLLHFRDEGTVEASPQDDLLTLAPFEGSRGIAQSSSINAEGLHADSTAGIVYPSEDAVDRDRLASTLGVEATERSITQEGRYVTVQASYDG